jgi:hypothetical protein
MVWFWAWITVHLTIPGLLGGSAEGCQQHRDRSQHLVVEYAGLERHEDQRLGSRKAGSLLLMACSTNLPRFDQKYPRTWPESLVSPRSPESRIAGICFCESQTIAEPLRMPTGSLTQG